MNDIWQLLNIERTNDAKRIKKAYAVQLKNFRPDENPIEFQRLHQAYKQALGLAKRSASVEFNSASLVPEVTTQFSPAVGLARLDSRTQKNPVEFERNPVSASPIVEIVDVPRVDDSLSDQGKSDPKPDQSVVRVLQQRASTDTEPLEVKSRAERDQLLLNQIRLKLESVLASKSRNKLEAWKFLTQNDYVLDPVFAHALGDIILRRLISYTNQYTTHPNAANSIDISLLLQLDSLFHWRINHQINVEALTSDAGKAIFIEFLQSDSEIPFGEGYLRDEFAGVRGGRIKRQYNQIKQPVFNNAEYYFGNLLKRMLAIALDLGLLGAIFMALFKLTEYWRQQWGVTVFYWRDIALIIMMLVYFPVLESRYQCTLGKFILGLRVTSRTFRKLNIWHSLLRFVFFAVTCVGNHITLLINAFLKGHLLHDRLSRSYVLDVRKKVKN